MTSHWSPRFTAYAKTKGMSPFDAIHADGGTYKYQLWLNERWREYCKLTGYQGMICNDTPGFDGWLENNVAIGD